MVNFAEEHASTNARQVELREMITRAEEKRSWFAAFREWVESVATFLDEKVRATILHLVLYLTRFDQVSNA